MTLEYGEPCFRCGVRPDVDCKHRPATEPPHAPLEAKKPRKAHHTAVHWKLGKGYKIKKPENKDG